MSEQFLFGSESNNSNFALEIHYKNFRAFIHENILNFLVFFYHAHAIIKMFKYFMFL